MTPPEPLRRESGRVYAVPSFRIMALVDREMASSDMRDAAAALLDLFLSSIDHTDMWSAHAGARTSQLKPVKIAPKRLEKLHAWLRDTDWKWPSTLRLNRWDEALELFAPPHLRLEQRGRVATFQIELPQDAEGLIGFADRVQAILADLPVLWGVMGFGMYQPLGVDSLIWMLPRVTPRYRCAIEVQPDRAESCLRRIAHLEELRQKITPVFTLPDIGWRTFIGDEFLPRLPDLPALASQPGIALSRGDSFTVVQAGAAPIWGDVNMAEDITPYRAVAHALKPCKPEWIRVRNGLFGGYENDNGLERIEQWYHRFDE